MRALIQKDGGRFRLEPRDWFYYTEKVRRAKYSLDDQALRPYSRLESVRDGAFSVASRLYGIRTVQGEGGLRYGKGPVVR